MSTAVATTEKPVSALIPEAELKEIEKFELTLSECQEAVKGASGLMEAFIQAKAMNAIVNGITTGMMNDIKQLMNSPIGFKTDRKPGQKDRNGKVITPYPDIVVKQCVAVALLAGAKLCGNEFNIIAWNAYFTKEFFTKMVLGFPGLSNFEMSFSKSEAFGAKESLVACFATWVFKGVRQELSCKQDGPGGLDTRVVVPRYATSGEAQMQGVAESRLLRLVFKKLTGMDVNCIGDMEANTVEAMVVNPAKKIEDKQASNDVAKIDNEPDAAELDMNDVYINAKDDIGGQTAINETNKMLGSWIKKVQGFGWSDEQKKTFIEQLNELAKDNNTKIRDSRG